MNQQDTRYKAPRHVQTERLELRPFTLADHPEYARITADPDVMRYIGAGNAVNTPEMAWRTMSGLLGHWEMLGYGIWAVQLRGGGLIGHAGYIDVPGWPGFELAYLFGKQAWGKGYAYEATSVALRIAYEGLGRDRVISLVRPGNAPSIRLAERLGAVQDGTKELLGSEALVFVHQRAQKP